SKSRIFSPKTTADMVSKSQSSSSAAGDDRGEEDKMDEEGISPPPRTARSLSASNAFDNFMPPMPKSPQTASEAIIDLETTTKEGVKFVLKAIKQERKKHKKTAMNPKAHLMVVPPISWKEGGQKASFIEWGCNPLVGFGLRNAGGGVVFLQIQLKKMDELYKTLEEVFKELRRMEKEEKEGGNKEQPRLRRRSHTYPSNGGEQQQQQPPTPAQPPTPVYDPLGDAMDLVMEGISDIRVDSHVPTPVGLPFPRIRAGPRPSYSPTPSMNASMNPMSDYAVRRRRLSSPPPLGVPALERAGGGSPVVVRQPQGTQPGSGQGCKAADTPMVKRVYWGSRPLGPSRDWGGSERAGEGEIGRMDKFLDEMGKAYGSGDGGEESRPDAAGRRYR
ncbi:hypothetical protein TrRE_jg11375, partial [Triparma retinervis]